MSPDFYFFQASFRSRLNHPYPRAEEGSQRLFAVFWFCSGRKVPRQMLRLKTQRERGTFSEKSPPPHPAETYNKRRTFPPNDKIPLAGRILSQERPRLLGQIERRILSRKSASPSILDKFLFHRCSSPLTHVSNSAFACGGLPIGCAQKTVPL